MLHLLQSAINFSCSCFNFREEIFIEMDEISVVKLVASTKMSELCVFCCDIDVWNGQSTKLHRCVAVCARVCCMPSCAFLCTVKWRWLCAWLLQTIWSETCIEIWNNNTPTPMHRESALCYTCSIFDVSIWVFHSQEPFMLSRKQCFVLQSSLSSKRKAFLMWETVSTSEYYTKKLDVSQSDFQCARRQSSGLNEIVSEIISFVDSSKQSESSGKKIDFHLWTFKL